MSKRAKAKRRARYYQGYRRCDDCKQVCFCIECRLEPWQVKPEEVLCHTCIHNSGYCFGCGQFWGGITSFEMRRSGLCDNCQHQVDCDFNASYSDDDVPFWEEDLLP